MAMATVSALLLGATGGCDDPSFQTCARGGVALLSWSIHGQPPTADQGCKGVQHVVVQLSSACNLVEIEPVPCISGERWRYDGLPGGPNDVMVMALDARQTVMARGTVAVTLDRSIPSAPTHVDLE
jgi:hypothetical protein